MRLFDYLYGLFHARPPVAATRRKPRMPRMRCQVCGTMVAYSAVSRRTSRHLCQASVQQRTLADDGEAYRANPAAYAADRLQ
jgi:hypothetical protein